MTVAVRSLSHSVSKRLINKGAKIAFILALIFALLPAVDGLWMVGKAQLAQQLLQNAWQKSLINTGEENKKVRPWPWADHWPVARLRWQAGDQDLLVLHGAHGASLAFAPGMTVAANGGRLISAHRDTHFQFLKDLTIGDQIQIQNNKGQWQSWQAEVVEIHNINKHQLWVAEDELVLISCYPFDQIEAGGPLRYVLRLRKVS